MPVDNARRLSVAPMMGWTNRHGRFFLRLMSRRALLYSEMIPAQALTRMTPDKRDLFLGFDRREKPLALQLGGSDPRMLQEAARMGEDWGYDEININMGCPSPRVAGEGGFGASLMRSPALAARLFEAVRQSVSLPVSVKCRLGLDADDPYETLPLFMESLIKAGCSVFIIHARKALLQGISPKANRHVPPLHYPILYEMKALTPSIKIVLNGGVKNLQDALPHLAHLDGVMIGRALCRNPYMLSDADRHIFEEDSRSSQKAGERMSREDVLRAFSAYAQEKIEKGTARPAHLFRMAAGLFHGKKGAQSFRRNVWTMGRAA